MRKTYSVGAIISAVLASLCCVAPFVLVMLGVSGAWIGNLRAFEPYRPLFILIAVGFLGAGFYKVYRKSAEVCEPGSICASPQTKKVGKIVLWGATVIVVFLLILPYLIGLLY
ncbi:MAG: mercury transporter MerT [Deltaproteobacteria bacterium]|nr:mercury transporter MerT [Deltaproteobacteria bacterium]